MGSLDALREDGWGDAGGASVVEVEAVGPRGADGAKKLVRRRAAEEDEDEVGFEGPA